MKRTSEIDAEILKEIPVVKKRGSKKNTFNLLFIAFILGVLYGSVLIRENGAVILDKLALINEVNLDQKANQSILDTFVQSFFSSSIFFLIIFLLGSSFLGQIVSFATIFIKGLGIGSCVAYLYINYATKGLVYSALIIMPTTIVSIFALIMLARESIRLSNLILESFLKEACKLSVSALKLYLYKALILYGFVIISAGVDCLMTFLFARLFSF